jgi:hypothetical protein
MSNARKVRFGCNPDGTRNDEQQRVIDQIADLWLETYQSATRVAEELNADGIPTARGGLWRDTTVRKILADNPERVAAAKERRTANAPKVPDRLLQLLDEFEEYDPKTGTVYTISSAPREPRPEEAAFRAAYEEQIRRYGQRWWLGVPKDVSDITALDRWRRSKTKRVPGKRQPNGGYPRGYWPMPAWYFFQETEKIAKVPCACGKGTFSNQAPRELYVPPTLIDDRPPVLRRPSRAELIGKKDR